jgi:hypothetical protein
MTTSLQLALIALFAASAVGADVTSRAGAWRDGAPVVLTLLGWASGLSMTAAVVISIAIGPWWRAGITFFGGGLVGGVEAVIQQHVPRSVAFVNCAASLTWLIFALANR